MKLLAVAALMLAPVFLEQAFAETATFVVHADVDCRWSVDGEAKGILKAEDRVSLSLPLGEHRVEAVAVDGGSRWAQTLKVTAAPGQAVEIQLRGYWKDPQTGLLWATSDNGSAVTLSQAAYYCQHLAVGGVTNWSLPSIDELRALFGGAANQGGFHLLAPIKLTGWEWSSSPGKEAGEQWALDFGDGARASVVKGDSGLNRALCVRR